MNIQNTIIRFFRKNPSIGIVVVGISFFSLISSSHFQFVPMTEPASISGTPEISSITPVMAEYSTSTQDRKDRSDSISQQDLLGYLKDRPFFDSVPNDPRKTYHIYLFGKDNTGLFITAKNFRQVIEVFQYEVSGNTLDIHFLNIDKRAKSRFTLEECKGPGSFDLKLFIAKDIKSKNGPANYFSWKKLRKPDGN